MPSNRYSPSDLKAANSPSGPIKKLVGKEATLYEFANFDW